MNRHLAWVPLLLPIPLLCLSFRQPLHLSPALLFDQPHLSLVCEYIRYHYTWDRSAFRFTRYLYMPYFVSLISSLCFHAGSPGRVAAATPKKAAAKPSVVQLRQKKLSQTEVYRMYTPSTNVIHAYTACTCMVCMCTLTVSFCIWADLEIHCKWSCCSNVYSFHECRVCMCVCVCGHIIAWEQGNVYGYGHISTTAWALCRHVFVHHNVTPTMYCMLEREGLVNL